MNSFEQEIKSKRLQSVNNISNNFLPSSERVETVLTLNDLKNLRKANVEMFTEDEVLSFTGDLQKSLESEEIDVDEFQKGIEEIEGLKKIKVDGLEKPFFLRQIEENDLEKAEGSRGGKVIGHTKSGKPIYEDAYHVKHKDFTTSDHSDAYDVHRRKMQKYEQREELEGKKMNKKEKADHEYHRIQANVHNNMQGILLKNKKKK